MGRINIRIKGHRCCYFGGYTSFPDFFPLASTSRLAEAMISTGLFSSVMSPAIKRLLNFRKPQDDDQDNWSDKAIKSLAKRLKKSGGLADLEAAITNPDKPSK